MKDIKGYEGLYAITSCGKVWSYRSKKFLKPSRANGGYLQVILYDNNISKPHKLHRLVAEAYLDNPNNLPCVNHKDENREHNYLNNLEWCSYEYNNNYGAHNERLSKSKSIAVFCVELNKVFESAKTASKELGLDRSNITKCLKGKYKTCGGYHWQYLEV